MQYKVVAQRTYNTKEYSTTVQLPTFYVEACSEIEANMLAEDILGTYIITKHVNVSYVIDIVES